MRFVDEATINVIAGDGGTGAVSFRREAWELYNVATDFSESINLASQYPERVEALEKLWWSEAAKHGALPLLEAPEGRRRTYDPFVEQGTR